MLYKFLAPFVGGFILLSFAISLKYRNESIFKSIFLYQFSVLSYIIFNYMEFVSTDITSMIFFSKFEHISMLLISLSWFNFSLTYTGYNWFFGKKIMFIIISVACLYTVIVFTNDSHNLIWKSIDIRIKNDMSGLSLTYGALFWPLVAYDYIFLVAGIVIIIISYIKGGSVVKDQAFFIISGFLFPLFANVIYIYKLIPGFNKDFSPIAFGFTSIFIVIAIYRFKLLHYSPITRNLILSDLDEYILTLDPKGRIADFNKKTELFFNIDSESLGSHILTTEAGDLIREKYSHILDWDKKKFIQKYKGKTFEILIKKIYIDNKFFKAILVSMSDITEKMKLINEVEDTNNRMKELHFQLIQNEKLAVLGQLSAGVAHEINNPLSFIKSNFNVLHSYIKKIDELCNEESERSNNLHHYLEEVSDILNDSYDGVLRISDVVKHLLGYSRDNSSSQTNVYDINQGIESTLVIAHNNIKYRAEVLINKGKVPSILTYGNEINQVLLNILTNAAQSIPEDRNDGLIEIKTFYENNLIICEISDNGIPIESNVKEQIFQPFYTTKGRDKGTGLGLSLSRNIIETEFNGKLFLKDCNRKTFRIEIPHNSAES